jgi:hypothetical protein
VKPPQHILPHSDFGDPECCGLLLPFERGDFVDIICNECGANVQTVEAADLRRTLNEMQLNARSGVGEVPVLQLRESAAGLLPAVGVYLPILRESCRR